jgi:Holliday junction resolvase
MQRNKGKVGEREFANWLKARGVSARRGQQFKGSPTSPDVEVLEWPHLHFEVKRCERLVLGPSMQQAIADAQGKVPVLAHRKNRTPWLVILRAEDFVKLMLGGEA